MLCVGISNHQVLSHCALCWNLQSSGAVSLSSVLESPIIRCCLIVLYAGISNHQVLSHCALCYSLPMSDAASLGSMQESPSIRCCLGGFSAGISLHQMDVALLTHMDAFHGNEANIVAVAIVHLQDVTASSWCHSNSNKLNDYVNKIHSYFHELLIFIENT